MERTVKMHYLWRAMKLTFKYKFTIISSIICALVLAFFWGTNIATVYPLVQISFQGQTVSDWYQIKLTEKQKGLDEIVIKLNETVPAAIPDKNKIQWDSILPKLKNSQAKNYCESLIYQGKALEEGIKYLYKIKPYIDRYAPKDPFMTVVYLMLFVIIGTYLKSVFTFAHGYLSGRIANLETLELRNVFFTKLLGYEANHFNQRGVSDTMSRFTGDLGNLSNGVTLIYGKFVREPFKMVVCVIGAIWVSWRLFLLTCIFFPLAVFLISWLGKSLKRVVKNSMIEMVSMYSRLSETFQSIRVVKSFNREDYELEKFKKVNDACYRRGMKCTKYGSLSNPITECLGMSILIFAILIGAWLVINQQTTIWGVKMSAQPLDLGQLILFYGFLLGAADPARRLSDFFLQIQGALAAAERVFEMIDRKVVLVDPEHPKEMKPFKDKIVFKNICYYYPKFEDLLPASVAPSKKNPLKFWKKKESASVPDSAKAKSTQKTDLNRMDDHRIVLNDVSLEIAFGETVAIVGPSGCGKSTLLGLIPRFYDPTSGSVSIDSIPYSELRMHDIREQIGMVTQEPVLFQDTVFENIRYGVPQATEEQVIDAAKKAYAHDFIIKELDQGYQTNVGPGGGRLSGGQRQRIALARAILKNPRIMLLDEATSQIDIKSEEYIHDALAKFVGNRTTIIVTHRLTAIRLADRIIVMQDGRIDNIGTHRELMETCPFYNGLWKTENLIQNQKEEKS